MVRTHILWKMQSIEEDEKQLFVTEHLSRDFSRFDNRLMWLHMNAFNSGRLSIIQQCLEISLQDDAL